MARFCRGKWGGPHDLDVVGQNASRACRACGKAYGKSHDKAYYEANREKIRVRRKDYWKAYYEANREKRLAYYEANREKKLAYAKQPTVASRQNTLQSLRRIRERRGRYEAQIRELLTQLGSTAP